MFELLDIAFKDTSDEPNKTELAHFLFFEQGIGLEKFNTYPIPYIIEMIRVKAYFRNKELEDSKKRQDGTITT
jgi:hypothetical protein